MIGSNQKAIVKKTIDIFNSVVKNKNNTNNKFSCTSRNQFRLVHVELYPTIKDFAT